MKPTFWRRILYFLCCLGLLCVNLQATGQFINQPTKLDLFNDCLTPENSPVGLLVTPLAPPEGQPQSVISSPLFDSNTTTSDPTHLLNNFINENVLKQMGVGIKLHF